MRPRPTRLLAAVGLLLLLWANPLGATGLVDPLLKFKQTRTAHFVIYFHQGEEPLAARLASLVEDVRAEVGLSLGLSTPALTHVVLADQSEVANGWATPLPRDIVFLNAAVPSGADMIGNTDDWLRLVFTHEFTHIVHLDRSGSWAWLVRGVFGRTPVAFPNLWLPQWQIEGLATWQESASGHGGRADAGDFRAMQSVAAALGRPLSLDRASGGLVRWPGGHAAYAAGLGFHEYLAQRFGERSLGGLATRTSRRLPFLGTRAFEKVYGQSLGTLWRDYTRQLAAASADVRTGPREARRLTRHGYVVTGPRFAAASCDTCPVEIVYSVQEPHAFPTLRAISVDGANDRALATRYLGSTVGTSPTVIVFDQQEVRRNVGLYGDLYLFDRTSGRVQPLTHEARLQDPDLSPDGTRIAAVREQGGVRELVIATRDPRPSRGRLPIRVLTSAPNTQFSTPRWSPDGRRIAAERRELGRRSEVVVIDAETGSLERTIASPQSRIVTPAWRPDGHAIVAAAAVGEQPFELFEFPLDRIGAARRLTRSAGALWPDVSSDGTTLLFAGYTGEGYDVFTVPYAPMTEGAIDLGPAPESPPPHVGERAAAETRDYSPLSTLGPTSWTPYITATSDQTRLGAGIAGADLLGRHAYTVAATWLVSGLDVVRPLPERVPDWNAAYVYSRWRPSVFVSASRDTLFREAVDEASHRYSIGVIQHELQGGVFVPVSHVRHSTQLLASVVRHDTRYLFPERDRSVTVVSSRFGAAYSSAKTYGYSISGEDGLTAGGTVEIARRTFGSAADATTVTADVRAYLPGARPNQVIALRGAAGLSRGDELARQAFVAGAVAASPSVIDFGSRALGLVRDGLSDAAGTRLVVGNAEYRMPLLRVERGIGTWPLFVRTVQAAVFVDVAQVRSAVPQDAGWRRAFGAELATTAVAGYALPFDAAIGASWGDDGQGRSGRSIYVRLGRAF